MNWVLQSDLKQANDNELGFSSTWVWHALLAIRAILLAALYAGYFLM
jgi:hypothetical protein